MNVTVVDYGRGNLFSLCQALQIIGAEVELTDRPSDIQAAECILLPGVGAFMDAISGLTDRGLVDPLREAAKEGTPLLGICVGCQMLMDVSYEFGEHNGLGLISGVVEKLPSPRTDDANLIRIPNVGWHQVEPVYSNGALGRLVDRNWMYFVHSYAPRPRDSAHVSATINVNGQDVAIAVEKGNIVGVQFHPEKSGTAGLALLRRFLNNADVS
jgi:imidazole glycerol-phosphate synthase subunit HisH